MKYRTLTVLDFLLFLLYLLLLFLAFYFNLLSNAARDPWIEHLSIYRDYQVGLIFAALALSILFIPKMSAKHRTLRFTLAVLRIVLIVLVHYFIAIAISKGANVTCYLLQCGEYWGDVQQPQ